MATPKLVAVAAILRNSVIPLQTAAADLHLHGFEIHRHMMRA
jgi:hypothetical protein